MMRPLVRHIALLTAVALTAASCSDDDTEPEASSAATTASEESSGYVSEVNGVMEGVNTAIREVVATLDGTYAEQSALFGAFETGELAVALETARDDASALEPPPEFESDHGALLAALDEASTVSERVTDAIDDRDIVELAAAVAELKTLQGGLTQQVSPELCEAVSPQLEEGGLDAAGRDLCVPVEEVGESKWAQGTARVARRFFLDFGDVAGRISAAAADGDRAMLEELFAESGRIVEAATASLSTEAREIIAPMFRVP